MSENENTDERLDRYAKTVAQYIGTGGNAFDPHSWRCYDGDCGCAKDLATDVTTVADAEQAEMLAEVNEWARRWHDMKAERDDAEAEVERLLAEIRDRESERADLRDRVQKAEPALERVREVVIEHWPEIPGDAIFAALDGEVAT